MEFPEMGCKYINSAGFHEKRWNGLVWRGIGLKVILTEIRI
jgi:hypothetical protein